MKDESKFHRWQIVSGLTLTNSTGPPFDHTTFSSTGRLSHVRATVASHACPPPSLTVHFATSQDSQKNSIIPFLISCDLVLVT